MISMKQSGVPRRAREGGLYGPNFIHPHPPPLKYQSRGGGCLKEGGGGIKFLPRGASKSTPPPPSPEKGPLARNGGRGGDVQGIPIE